MKTISQVAAEAARVAVQAMAVARAENSTRHEHKMWDAKQAAL